MIKPALQDAAFLADVRDAASSQDDLHIWWLGQSGFLVQWRGSHLLFDPYLSDSLSRKYATTEKPHTRMTERVVSPATLALDFIDLTTSSHNHTDHLDGETLAALMQTNPEMELLVPSSANRRFAAERLGVNPDQLEAIDLPGSRSRLARSNYTPCRPRTRTWPRMTSDVINMSATWPSLARGRFITAATPSRTTAWRRF